ncbi:MAG: hypothetical protein AB7C89_02480 [Intestinibacillus sp.]
MNRMDHKRSGAGLFLMELSIGLLIFAFAAAVCTAVFACADRISRDGAVMSRAVAIARNAAELVRAGQGLPETAYDAQGAPTEGVAVYSLRTEEEAAGDGLTEVLLTVLDAEGRSIYTLTTVKGEGAP